MFEFTHTTWYPTTSEIINDHLVSSSQWKYSGDVSNEKLPKNCRKMK